MVPERHISLDLKFTSRPLKLLVFGPHFYSELFIGAFKKHWRVLYTNFVSDTQPSGPDGHDWPQFTLGFDW